jgi:hypothetical protein
MEDVVAAARTEAEREERRAVATEIAALVDQSTLTRAEFARRSGTSPSRLSTYLAGTGHPVSRAHGADAQGSRTNPRVAGRPGDGDGDEEAGYSLGSIRTVRLAAAGPGSRDPSLP